MLSVYVDWLFYESVDWACCEKVLNRINLNRRFAFENTQMKQENTSDERKTSEGRKHKQNKVKKWTENTFSYWNSRKEKKSKKSTTNCTTIYKVIIGSDVYVKNDAKYKRI